MTPIMALTRRVLSALFALTALFYIGVAPADAGELKVAAASDLTFAFKDVGARFEKQTGNSLKLTYGSSGNFFSQIQNGAPFDLFFSADVSYPQTLEAAGLTEPGTIYDYATGKLVMWVPNTSKLDLSRGLSVLLDPAFEKSQSPILCMRPTASPRSPHSAMRESTTRSKESSCSARIFRRPPS